MSDEEYGPMSDEEYDHLSDAFLMNCDDIYYHRIIQSERKSIEVPKEQKEVRGIKKNKYKLTREIEKEKLLNGLQTPLASDNRGYELLQKMGFKPGSGLGRKGEGRSDPIAFDIPTTREGIGRNSHFLGVNTKEARSWKEVKGIKVSSFPDYHPKDFEGRIAREADIDLCQGPEICHSLDKRKQGTSVQSEGGELKRKYPFRPTKKKSKKQRQLAGEGFFYAPSFGECNVAIIPEGYPEILLTSKQIDEVSDLVLDCIRKLKHKGNIHPRFDGISMQSGGFLVKCLDTKSKAWAQTAIAGLELYGGIKLQVVDVSVLKKNVRAGAYFPLKEGQDIDVLRKLRIQNPDQDFTNWSIVGKKEGKAGIFIIFRLPETGDGALVGDSRLLFYGLGRVKLRLFKKEQKQQEQKDEKFALDIKSKFGTEINEDKILTEASENRFQTETSEDRFQTETIEDRLQTEISEYRLQTETTGEDRFNNECSEDRLQIETAEDRFKIETDEDRLQIETDEDRLKIETDEDRLQIETDEDRLLQTEIFEERIEIGTIEYRLQTDTGENKIQNENSEDNIETKISDDRLLQTEIYEDKIPTGTSEYILLTGTNEYRLHTDTIEDDIQSEACGDRMQTETSEDKLLQTEIYEDKILAGTSKYRLKNDTREDIMLTEICEDRLQTETIEHRLQTETIENKLHNETSEDRLLQTEICEDKIQAPTSKYKLQNDTGEDIMQTEISEDIQTKTSKDIMLMEANEDRLQTETIEHKLHNATSEDRLLQTEICEDKIQAPTSKYKLQNDTGVVIMQTEISEDIQTKTSKDIMLMEANEDRLQTETIEHKLQTETIEHKLQTETIEHKLHNETSEDRLLQTKICEDKIQAPTSKYKLQNDTSEDIMQTEICEDIQTKTSKDIMLTEACEDGMLYTEENDTFERSQEVVNIFETFNTEVEEEGVKPTRETNQSQEEVVHKIPLVNPSTMDLIQRDELIQPLELEFSVPAETRLQLRD